MEPEKKDKNKKNSRTTSIIIMVTILAAVIIVLLIFLMQGSTTTTGNYPENLSDKSLSCEAEGKDYPFYTYDNAIKKITKVDVLFSQDKMKSIALTYNLYYNDVTSITTSEAHNHAAMNKSFAADGLKVADAYNAKYARMEDRMQLNLYTTASDFDNIAKKYFLIDKDTEIPTDMAGFENVYKKAGMKCEIVKN